MADKPENTVKPIQYRIEEITIVDYNSTDPQCVTNRGDLKNTDVAVTAEIRIDKKKGTIEIIIDAVFSIGKGDSRQELFRIKSSHIFMIRDFNKTFTIKKNNQVNIPDPLIMNFIGVAVSGTRGMIAARNQYHEYKDIILPLIDVKPMIEDIKKKQTKNKSASPPSIT